MPIETTARHALPLLSAGQAQKEIAHNEALTIADFMLNPVVQSAGADDPPSSPGEGLAWIVGTSPTGGWAGHANAIACCTAGGWRFVVPFAGLHVWRLDAGVFCVFDGFGWNSGIVAATQVRVGGVQVIGAQGSAIADPSGGATVDSQARAALLSILGILRSHGLIST